MTQSMAAWEEFHHQAAEWLVSSEIRGPAGEIYSWLNDSKPGYLYPEIMGYYVKFLSSLYRRTGKRVFLERALQTAETLISLVPRSGAVSRGGIDFVFDSAICLSGLLAISSVAGTQKYRKTIQALAFFVSASLQKGCVAFHGGRPAQDDTSWSLSYGASTLKACIALQEAGDFLGDKKLTALSEKIAAELVEGCFKEGFFTINPRRPWVYTHAHCYATEALLYLQKKGYDHAEAIRQSADWLAKSQNDDGSLFNWYFHPEKPQEKQGDATAQAIRIWLAVDREKYGDNIQKAFDFLKGLQTPEGGLLYSQGSQDVNSWVTLFAAQAAGWLLSDPEVEWIV